MKNNLSRHWPSLPISTSTSSAGVIMSDSRPESTPPLAALPPIGVVRALICGERGFVLCLVTLVLYISTYPPRAIALKPLTIDRHPCHPLCLVSHRSVRFVAAMTLIVPAKTQRCVAQFRHLRNLVSFAHTAGVSAPTSPTGSESIRHQMFHADSVYSVYPFIFRIGWKGIQKLATAMKGNTTVVSLILEYVSYMRFL